MVRDVQRIAEEEGLLIAVFGHAGDGNLHPTCCIDDRDPDQVARVHRAFERIFDAALARGGTITGEHGIGVTKLQYLEKRLGPVGIDLLRGIKRAFDPLGLLNPGQGGAVSARTSRLRDAGSSRTTCCAPASRAASASRPARPTRTRATRPPRRAGASTSCARSRPGRCVEDDVREEFSFCLGCRACEPVCPAGVRYGTLLEHGRDAVGPARDPKLRALLLAVATPRRTRLVGRMMRTGQLLGLHRIAPSRALRAAGRSAPKVAAPAAWRMRRAVGAEDGEPAALFLGCVGHLMFSGASHAACGTLAAGGLLRHDAARAGLLRCAARAQRRSRRRARAGRLDGALVRRQHGARRHDGRRLRRLHGRLRHAARHARGRGLRRARARLLDAARRARPARRTARRCASPTRTPATCATARR